ncbi:MAG: cytochrome c oxidase subunit II [Planctomycetota bacterium]|jgi:cytochrome c oxidase subunit 2
MLLRLSLLLALMLGLSSVVAADELSSARIDELVAQFDPNQVVDIANAFTAPASEISEDVQSAAWFSLLVFLPFLILPQVLLVVVIVKFRKRGDNDERKPATFTHNNKLEIFWTAVPVLALIVVAIPMTKLLHKTDLPPEHLHTIDELHVEVVGKQFAWKYAYPEYDITVDFAARQQPVVLEKDRLTTMSFMSNDVNHAWAVPAFGIKKDCFPAPRVNYAWFTPKVGGFFDGQCYELCGEDHGKMIVTAIVADEPEFDIWVGLQRHRVDAGEVVEAVRGGDVTAARAAVAAYLTADRSAERRNALRYWLAQHYNVAIHDAELATANGVDDADDAAIIGREAATRRAELDALITAEITLLDTAVPALEVPAAAGQES